MKAEQGESVLNVPLSLLLLCTLRSLLAGTSHRHYHSLLYSLFVAPLKDNTNPGPHPMPELFPTTNLSTAGESNSGDKYVWAWYAFLCIVGAFFNVSYLAYTYSKTPSKDSYGAWMKNLAVPWVLECAWRSVFPSLYLQRFAFWNVWMNAIIVDRCWAVSGFGALLRLIAFRIPI